MFSLQRCSISIGRMLLYGFAICSSVTSFAAPALTTIQDVLYKADGAKFDGIATISWDGFEAVDSTTIPPQTITVRIVDGFVRVQLVPTTNAITPASYTVVYNSDGKSQATENWIVPPSNVPLRIREVRVGGPGSVLGGGQPPQTQTSVQISDILGLTAALNVRPVFGTGYTASRAAVINAAGAIDGALGDPSDCVHVDGSSAPCGGSGPISAGVFVDGEAPSGPIDGSNGVFALASAPEPASSLNLYRNGLLLKQGLDYTVSNANIVFSSLSRPASGDILIASYRNGVAQSGASFVDAEVPSGSLNGVNSTFLLANAPNPVTSLAVYRNGLRLRVNLDYAISGATLVFLTGSAPQPGDILQCFYRTQLSLQ